MNRSLPLVLAGVGVLACAAAAEAGFMGAPADHDAPKVYATFDNELDELLTLDGTEWNSRIFAGDVFCSGNDGRGDDWVQTAAVVLFHQRWQNDDSWLIDPDGITPGADLTVVAPGVRPAWMYARWLAEGTGISGPLNHLITLASSLRELP